MGEDDPRLFGCGVYRRDHRPHYTASKAALIGLAHALANPLAPHGVTVNALAPALVGTEMLSGDAENPERARQ
jgi:NAD(P)-dependent dehydrogenase (short-subunit alcohol dehydrogenase family)